MARTGRVANPIGTKQSYQRGGQRFGISHHPLFN
jgi:hypothetical protein